MTVTDPARPQVHSWDPNSNAGKPLFALAEKGVPFEFHYVSLTDFEQHQPEYLALNPAGTVPTMVHGGRIFTESTPLCEYISGAFPGIGLVPDDPKARYRMRHWCRVTDESAHALSVIGWHTYMGPMVRQRGPEALERLIARIPTKERRIWWRTASSAAFTEAQLANARARVGEWVAALDRRLGASPWLAGPAFSVADIVTFANAYALPLSFPEFAAEDKVPHYFAWLRRIYARPATMATFALSRSLARRAFEVARRLGVTADDAGGGSAATPTPPP